MTIRVFDEKRRAIKRVDSQDYYTESRQIWTITGYYSPSSMEYVAMAMIEDLVVVASRRYGMGLLNTATGEEVRKFVDTAHRRVIAVDIRRWDGSLQIILQLVVRGSQ